MRFSSFMVVLAATVTLAGCKMETVGDPTLSKRDVALMALAPNKATSDTDKARYRVSYLTQEKVGTIIINSNERKLYLVEENGTALRYAISVGQDAYRWTGEAVIGGLQEWPDWIPGEEARRLKPELPERVKGGPLNPLGSRAIYLHDEKGKDTEYRIHGTNEPNSIGRAVSLGCIRMRNIDAIDLYTRVKVGNKVIVN
jgi:lipoprotein-anchoring transpeptidase ErfK/SrfK